VTIICEQIRVHLSRPIYNIQHNSWFADSLVLPLFLYCQLERPVLLTSTFVLRCYLVRSNTEQSCIQKRNKLKRKENSQVSLAGWDSRQRRNRLVTWSVQDSPQSECRPAVTPRQGMLMTHPPMLGLPTQQVHLPRGRKRSRPLDTAPCFKKWDNSTGPDQNKGGFHFVSEFIDDASHVHRSGLQQ